jgi:hypothetical protein
MFGMPRTILLPKISSAEITDWIAEFNIRIHEEKSQREQAKMLSKLKGRR